MKARTRIMGIIGACVLVSTGIFVAHKPVRTEPAPPSLGGATPDAKPAAPPIAEAASQLAAAQTSPAPQDPLVGFYGPYGLKQPEGNGVVVLTPALTTTSAGPWQAWGLVRNESLREVGAVSVTASLMAQDGTILAQPTGRVPLDSLRPGEPAPFTLSSTVDSSRVARVTWQVSAGEPQGRLVRDLGPTEERILPFGAVEYKGVKRSGPPYPYVLNLEFFNKGTPLKDVQDVKVTVAWLDKEQRVVWVAGSSLTDGVSHSFPTGAHGLFSPIVIEDEVIAKKLDHTTTMYWLYAHPQ